eukprot:TRINITY_DN3279_c0_g1_i8.p1 TRINITY_DN3279_c0_g1~~TRINITY_DN3279_c0_g1_i8.p1  ORF type:complete len:484 (+),score=35.40 TRINITY_DN3279_c0_g1_i8:184-1635(+)
MAGKTWLIIEASKQIPIIYILLISTNRAYGRLCRYVSLQQEELLTNNKEELQFENSRRCHNRIIFYIRCFFLAYMEYYKEFTAAAPGDDKHKRTLLCGSLRNGCSYVAQLLENLIKRFSDKAGVVDMDVVIARHRELAEELGNPAFALDECHTLFDEAKGALLHHNHKKFPRGDVVVWQHDELTGQTRAQPVSSYPYRHATSLYNGFLTVLREYLTAQMTIWTSTMFSIWGPLFTESECSRDYPKFHKLSITNRLTVYNMKTVLKSYGFNLATLLAAEPLLTLWKGRPGFFFDHFLLQVISTPERSIQRIQASHDKAKSDVERFLDQGFERLTSIAKLKPPDSSAFACTGERIALLLAYSATLRGGNVACHENGLACLVKHGFASVIDYEKPVGIIQEPMVLQYLLKKKNIDDNERFIFDLICTDDDPKRTGVLMELAMVNQIIALHGRPLSELLLQWGADISKLPNTTAALSIKAYSATILP